MLALGQAGLGAGGGNGGVDDLGVTRGFNDLLRNEDFVADGAVLAFGQTGLGAGGSNSGVDDLGVARGFNDLLRNENFVADGAVLALGETRLGAGGSNGGVNDLGVSRCGDDCLRDLVITARAVTALGQAGLRAGRRNGGILDNIVAQSGDHGTGLEQCAAGLAVGVAGVAVDGAGGCLFVAKHGLGMGAIRVRVLERDVIDRNRVALPAALLRVVECNAGAVLAVQRGQLQLDMGLEIDAPIQRGHLRLGVPERRPCFAAVVGNLYRQVHGFLGQQLIVACCNVKFQRCALAAEVYGRRDQPSILRGCVGPALIIVFDQRDLRVIQGLKGRLVPLLAAGSALVFDRPAAGREVGVLEVIVEVNAGLAAGNLEAGLDGVCAGDVLKGVARDRTDGGAVDQHVADLVAELCGDGEGLALALLDVGPSRGSDRAALTRGRGDLGIALDVGLDACGLHLDIVDRGDAGIVFTGRSRIMPAQEEISDAQLFRNRYKGTIRIYVADQRIAEGIFGIPDCLPRVAAVCRCFKREGELMSLHAVVRICIVELKIRIRRPQQIDRRSDQAFVLLVFAGADISSLRLIEVVIAVASPRLCAAVDLPALRRELLAFKILLKEDFRCLGDQLKAGFNVVVLIDIFQRVGRGFGYAAAVDAIGGEAVAAVGRRRQGEAAAVSYSLYAVRRNAAALGRLNIDRVAGAGGGFAEGHIDAVVNADHLEGVVIDCTEVLAVHDKGGDFIALVRDRGKGLGRALADKNSAGGGQRAVFARSGIDGDVVLRAVLIDFHIAEAVLRAALIGGVDESEADIILALIGIGDNDLGLRVCPVGVEAGIMQIPDGLPVFAVICGDVDVDIEVRVLDAEGVAGVKGEDHVRRRILTGEVVRRRVEPFVLIDLVAVNACEPILVAMPALDGVALGFDRPAVGQPLALEILGVEDHIVGDLNVGIVVGVVLRSEVELTGVAGVVVNGQADGLAVAGDVDVLEDGGSARGVLADADGLIDLAVLRVGQYNSRDVLIIREGDRRVVAALGLADGHIEDLRSLGIDRDGERPRIADIRGFMLVVDRGGRDGDRRLGVVRQIKAVDVRAVPRVDRIAVVGECTGGDDLIGAGIIDGLRLVIDGLFIVDRAVRAGDAIGQRSCRAQHTGVDPRQGIKEIIVVRGDGVAVSQIGDGVVVVVLAEVGVHGLFHGLQQSLVIIGLRGGVLLRAESFPPEAGVNDRGLGPVAVEGKERGAQIDAVLIFRTVGVGGLQNGPAFDECAVFKLRKVLLWIRELDGDDDFLLTVRRNNDQIIFHIGREGAGKDHIRFGHENIAVLVFLRAVGEDDGRRVVIQGAVAGVVDRELQLIDAGLGHIVAKLHLRAVHTGNGDVGLGLDGRVDIHEACALTARGNGRIAVVDDICRAHEQSVDQMLALRGVHVGVLRLDRLRNDCHAARNVRGGHGRAGHQLIGAFAGDGGIDVAAGGGDLGLERQLGGGTPRGEVAHTGDRRGHELIGDADGQVLVLLLCKVSAILLGDERDRNFPRADGHIDDARLVVVNDHGNCAGCRSVVRLGLVVHTAAALHDRDLALDIYRREVLLRAVAADHDVLHAALIGNGAQRPCGRDLLRVGIIAVVVGNVAVADRDVRGNHTAVFDCRDGQGFMIGRRFGNVAVVGVGGKGLAAVVVAVGCGVGVTGGDRHGNAALADAVKDVNEIRDPLALRFVINEAAVRAEGHVDGVNADDHAVLKCRNDIVVGRAAGGLKDLHVEDLCLGRNAAEAVLDAVVAGRSTGNVCAVAGVAVDGVAVGVVIAVVELERDLFIVIQRGGAGIRGILLAVHVVFIQRLLDVIAGQAGILRRILEQLVRHVNAGVKDGNDGPFAVVAGRVGVAAADHAVAGGHVRVQLEGRRDKRCFNALDLADLLELCIGHVGGEAVGQRGVAVHHLQRLAVHDLLRDFLLHGGLCLAHPVLCGAGRAAAFGDLGFVEQDDHADDLIGVDFVIFLFEGLSRGFVRAEKRIHDLSARAVFGFGVGLLGCKHCAGQQREKKRQNKEPSTKFFHRVLLVFFSFLMGLRLFAAGRLGFSG